MIAKTGLHSIRALAVLAAQPEGRCLDAATVASRIDAPPNFLGKLLHNMVRRGLVESRKGPGGGFRLGRPASSIRLVDVVEAEFVDRWSTCALGRSECSDDFPCVIHDRWKKVRQEYLQMLTETTIADVLPEGRPTESP